MFQVDGAYAAVKFPTLDSNAESSGDVDSFLQDCRLLRKDELQVLAKVSKSLKEPHVYLFGCNEKE